MPDNLTQFPLRPQIPIVQIEAAAQALIDLLNALGGDPEAEPDDPLESNGDDLGDTSWPEFHTLGRHKAVSLRQSLPNEDFEDDDPAEDGDLDSCSAGDDRGTAEGGGDDGQPGDPDDGEDGHDAERETWSHPDDHPAELFVGRRPANANNPPDAA